MTRHATGTFTIDSWDEETHDEAEGAVLAGALVTKTFSGDLVGTSVTRLLLCRAQVETSAAYAGFERFTGTLAGRGGSFVLHHDATMDADVGQSLSWTVVPDSGTGELRHLRGDGQIIVAPGGGHSYTLEFELP